MMRRKSVDVAVIIPDASPVLTLARINRLDLFNTFLTPIHIVDQVQYEITKPANDPDERVAAWLNRMDNQIINAQRKSTMIPLERPGRTRRVRSQWMRQKQP